VYPGREVVEQGLLRLNGAALVPALSSRLEFRRDKPGAGMPDASASIEDYGLHFCDYGGGGREYLGQVVAWLVSRFGAVAVTEF
jgi:hypothetical protein